MLRRTGGLEALHDALPQWAAYLAALVTQLGDVWFLTVVIVAVSWIAERERGPWPLGVLVGGFALLTALKYAFALPRPRLALLEPEAVPENLRLLYVATGTAHGYGFPSGHAFGTTVAYGLVAATLVVWTRRRRVLAAAGLVALVSLSRVVLGVHYVVDVVVGVLVGLAYLGAARWLLERSSIDRTTLSFALAVGLGLVAATISDVALEGAALLAVAAGGLAAWSTGSPSVDRRPSRRSRWTLVAAALALAVAVGIAGSWPALTAAALGAGFVLVAPFASLHRIGARRMGSDADRG